MTRLDCSRRLHFLVRIVLLGISVFLFVQPGWADDKKVQFGDNRTMFGKTDTMVTASLGVITALLVLDGPPNQPRWAGGIGPDDNARLVFRGRSDSLRKTAAFFSDLALGSLIVWPMLDSSAVALSRQSNDNVAGQLSLIGTQSFLLTGALYLTARNLAARERPYASGCKHGEVMTYPNCRSWDNNASFFSGHSAMSFTGAGLLCRHHSDLPLYGGSLADTIPCVVGVSLAATTAMLRMVADKHYFSDVFVGALVGFTSGFVVPSVLYNHSVNRSQASTTLSQPSSHSGGAPVLTYATVF